MAKGSARRAKVIKAMIAFVVILALLTFKYDHELDDP